jgi:peptidoglycan hydrolase-like protein with peptidoglycan-binding domain
MPSMIKYGSQGADVATAQQLLNGFGYSLTIDGVFGSVTEDTVRDFQSRSGLAVDGVIGPATWEALDAPLTVSGTQGEKTTGTVSPVPVKSGVPAVYNQLNQQGAGTGSTGSSSNWKIWAVIAALGFGAWWILKNSK